MTMSPGPNRAESAATPAPAPLLLWWCAEGSTLAQPVCSGLQAVVHVIEDAGVALTPVARLDRPAAVRVIEIQDARPDRGPAWLASRGLLSPQVLSLVLLPAAVHGQSAAWLNAGADRCMPADSPLPLLRAMIRSMLHRCRGQAAACTEHGPLRFEHDTNTLFHHAERLPLTCRETLVARLLFQSGARPVRPADILRALGGEAGAPASPSLVSLYVHRLNRKIRPYGLGIAFKRGYGYLLGEHHNEEDAGTRVGWLGVMGHRSGTGWPTPGPRA